MYRNYISTKAEFGFTFCEPLEPIFPRTARNSDLYGVCVANGCRVEGRWVQKTRGTKECSSIDRLASQLHHDLSHAQSWVRDGGNEPIQICGLLLTLTHQVGLWRHSVYTLHEILWVHVNMLFLAYLTTRSYINCVRYSNTWNNYYE